MATIVLIHGIAQEQRGADALEAEWLPSLASGVRTANFPELADAIWRSNRPGSVETRMAFYGDLFLTAGKQGAGAPELSPEAAALAEQLAEEWLRRAAKRSGDPVDRAEAARQLALLEGEVAQTQGARAPLRSVLKRVARLKWFAVGGFAVAETFLARSLAQVSLYLTDDSVRAAALERVEQLIGDDTRVLVGHSLGSVIAFEAAHRSTRPLALVTLGSPLGLHTIIYERLWPQPPTIPPHVTRWVNLADRDDLVAAEPDLVPLFPAAAGGGATLESTFLVDNGSQPHAAAFYLTKRECGAAVHGAIDAAVMSEGT